MILYALHKIYYKSIPVKIWNGQSNYIYAQENEPTLCKIIIFMSSSRRGEAEKEMEHEFGGGNIYYALIRSAPHPSANGRIRPTCYTLSSSPYNSN